MAMPGSEGALSGITKKVAGSKAVKGSTLGPWGVGVGAALDIAGLVADYTGGKEQAEEEKRRYDKEMGLTEWQMAYLQRKEERERQKRIAISNALVRAMGGQK